LRGTAEESVANFFMQVFVKLFEREYIQMCAGEKMLKFDPACDMNAY
jgi:valyl-tRNA synthetase